MQAMTSQQKLEYAKILQKIHNIYIVKENLYFTHKNKNYNKAAKQIETILNKQLTDNITATIDGTISLPKKIDTDYIITTALKNQHKMLTKEKNRYLTTATKNNIKTYNKILQNRIQKEQISLQSKIEEELRKQKYNNLTNVETKKILKEKFNETGTKRAKNIIRDALHTNESNLSWITNLNNDYKYKIWMNGRGKGKVRAWHRAKMIQPCYIDDYFDIYGSFHAQMMYPGDFNGGAENVANCRCWIQYTNTPPSNLKSKGTIQINPNINLNSNNNERFNQNNYNITSNIKNKIRQDISKIKNRFNTFKNTLSIKFNNNNTIHRQTENNYKNQTENSDYNFDEDKVYKKLRNELPKDFGDKAIKYIILKLKTNANSSIEKGQIFNYKNGEFVSIEFKGNKNEVNIIPSHLKIPYKNMTDIEKRKFEENPKSFMIRGLNKKEGPFSNQHNHTDVGLTAPSAADFYSIMWNELIDYSVIINKKEIWVIEAKGKFKTNEILNVHERLEEFAKNSMLIANSKNFKKNTKERRDFLNENYSSNLKKYINEMGLYNIKVIEVKI